MEIKLPIDIWWKIIIINWKDKYLYHGMNNPMISKQIFKDINIFGKNITTDIFIFRKLCKTTKRMVEKYTTRYKSKIILNSYMIVFNYSNNYIGDC